jgi:beta-phosphoglucomutase-like phosphatase (HAD superfamily)
VLDLDGVVTDTASLHEQAWRDALDALLPPNEALTHAEYLRDLDGRPRLEGARAFVRSRALLWPLGSPGDGPEDATVYGLAARKDRRFHGLLEERGVGAFHDALAALQRWRDESLSLGLVSSSRNAGAVVEAASLLPYFDAQVDGEVGAELGLAGKPAPDYFLEAARRLDTPPERCAAIEDAVSGVLAARRAGFGLVVGLERRDAQTRALRDAQTRALRDAGADLVVRDLSELARRLVAATRARDESEPTSFDRRP